jgi:hypothetical protein
MLAKKFNLRLDNGEVVGTTPMLVPSISSRINIDITKIIEMISETITGPILISAYDMKYIESFPPISFPSILFVDSGGYECAKDREISEIGLYRPDSHQWNRDKHSQIIESLETSPPTKVVISYDHPSERISIEEQIRSAKELFNKKEGIIKELLIKPESIDPNRLDIKGVMQNVEAFSPFDIIGFTEKELGPSVLERMKAIAKIRREMNRNDINIPIHVFGSLDPVTTPLYYMSGADIFDGLSWLRFIFSGYNTFYIDSFGPLNNGIEVSMKQIWGINVAKNYQYITRLNMNLGMFKSTGEYKFLGEHKDHPDFYKNSYEYLIGEIGGES